MNLKKPKFWDYKKPNFLAYILYPLSYLVKIANNFSKKNIHNKFKIKTICIGNFYVGGTGKTSLSIKLNEILIEKKIRSCFIKKFYKDQIDEQKLLEKNGKLFLSSNRIDAIRQAENKNYEIAILDDGLQDKSINTDLKFVCFNTINWIGNGMTIPAGPLREDLNNLANYEHVFLNGNLENLDILKQKLIEINSNINIHIGKYHPSNLNEFKKNKKYLVFSGIGNHQTFISMIKNNGLNVIKDIEFPDHYKYKKNDIDKILFEANNLNCEIITTEKDKLRIKDIELDEIKILKSELKIIDEEKFIRSIF